MSRDSVLVELGRRLLACADRTLLDLPLDQLSQRVTDLEARELLQAVHEAGDADCLRDLLDEARLGDWISNTATAREAHVLAAQLNRFLGVGDMGGDDPARLAVVPPLPTELEAMLAWARPYGLLGELSRPAREVLANPGMHATDASLVEQALGKVENARAYLVQQARSHAALSARETLWRTASVIDGLKPVAERLRASVGDTGFTTLHAFRFVPAREVSIDADTAIARGQITVDDPRGSIAVKVFLSGYEQRALHTECELCGKTDCVHARVLAARLLDACFDRNDRLHSSLLAITQEPSWKRFLRALDLNEAPTDATTQRVSFRLQLDADRVGASTVMASAVLQQRDVSGRWSAGKVASPVRLMRSSHCTDRDMPALEAMTLANRSVSARPVSADLTLLRALVEHPFVTFAESGDPVRISEQSVEVTLVEQPEGLLPRITLAGAALSPGERPRGASYVLTYDEPNATLVFAALTTPLRRLLIALASFRGVLPKESYAALAPWLASLRQVARVSTPQALVGTERPAPTKLLLRITPGRDQGIDLALMQRVLPLAPLWPPGHGPELAHGLEEGKQVFVRRDLNAERERARHVIETLQLNELLRLEPFAYRIEDNQTALALLSNAARLHDQIEIEWPERTRQLRVTATLRTADLKIEMSKKGQWFSLEGGARHAGIDLAIGHLLDAARRGERFVVVQGHDHVEIEQELFERLQRAQLCTNESVREPLMAAAAAPFWMDLLGAASSGADAATRAWLKRSTQHETTLPEAWRERLRDYQREGVAWSIERSSWAPGVCLADDMGLGKTVQAIALLETRAELGAALVIAPTSVVDQWRGELARFAPTLTVHTHQGKARRKQLSALGPRDVLVTSYELLLRDQAHFEPVTFATQIIDEAQMVKNAHAQRSKAVAQINASFRIALSGTPVENRLGDLWSLFQLIAPGLLGSWARFRARFAVPIERYENEERAAALRRLVSPFILRREKSQVALELPSRTEVTHMIELSPAERDLYDSAVRQARRAVGKSRKHEASRSMKILAELTRLRQLACHPRLVVEDARVESSKLNALMQLLDDILPRGHRVLVFSQFTRHLALVREALERANITSLYLDGSTPAAERSAAVKAFQARQAPVFLISLKAGGTGLNLTAADYVVHMDPWWNPAAEDQASDRAHRLGQTQPLTIVKLVAQGTIEERVLALHGHKRRLAEAVLAGTAQPTSLDLAALEELL